MKHICLVDKCGILCVDMIIQIGFVKTLANLLQHVQFIGCMDILIINGPQ